MNKETKNVVYRILESDADARKDDWYLVQRVLVEMLPCNQGTAFGQVLQGMKYKGISFESITRHRRKFLEQYPYLKDAKTEEARMEERENYFLEYGRKTIW